MSGLFAAKKLLNGLNLPNNINIIPIRDDELQVKLGKSINKKINKMLNPFGLLKSWLR